MKYIITLIIMSNLSLFSQGWIQTAELDTVRYRSIKSYGNSTYLFNYHTNEVGILRSSDDGITWDTIIDGNPVGFENENPTVFELVSEEKAFACLGSSGNLFKYDFSKKSIENLKLDATRSIKSIKMLDENNGICGTDIELFITDDGWKTTKKFEVKKLEEVYIKKRNSRLEFYYITSDEYLENKSRFYSSSDSGATWDESLIGEIRALDLLIQTDGTILVTAGKNEQINGNWKYSDLIYKSTDNGKSWVEKLNVSFDHRVDLDDINFFDEKIGIACGQNTSTYLTFDGGETWEIQNVKDVEELSIRPTFGGFTQTKFILGIWNKGLFQKDISISSVTDLELISKYRYRFIDNILLFEKPQNINYEIFNLTGQRLLQGTTNELIDLNQIGRGILFININNEYTVKLII